MLMKRQEKKRNTELDFFFKINGGAKPQSLFSAAVQLIIVTVNIIVIIIRLRYRKCSKDAAERKQEGSKHCECSFTPRVTFTLTVRNSAIVWKSKRFFSSSRISHVHVCAHKI